MADDKKIPTVNDLVTEAVNHLKHDTLKGVEEKEQTARIEAAKSTLEEALKAGYTAEGSKVGVPLETAYTLIDAIDAAKQASKAAKKEWDGNIQISSSETQPIDYIQEQILSKVKSDLAKANTTLQEKVTSKMPDKDLDLLTNYNDLVKKAGKDLTFDETIKLAKRYTEAAKKTTTDLAPVAASYTEAMESAAETVITAFNAVVTQRVALNELLEQYKEDPEKLKEASATPKQEKKGDTWEPVLDSEKRPVMLTIREEAQKRLDDAKAALKQTYTDLTVTTKEHTALYANTDKEKNIKAAFDYTLNKKAADIYSQDLALAVKNNDIPNELSDTLTAEHLKKYTGLENLKRRDVDLGGAGNEQGSGHLGTRAASAAVGVVAAAALWQSMQQKVDEKGEPVKEDFNVGKFLFQLVTGVALVGAAGVMFKPELLEKVNNIVPFAKKSVGVGV